MFEVHSISQGKMLKRLKKHPNKDEIEPVGLDPDLKIYKVILIKGPPFNHDTETLEFSRTIKTATIEHKYTKVSL